MVSARLLSSQISAGPIPVSPSGRYLNVPSGRLPLTKMVLHLHHSYTHIHFLFPPSFIFLLSIYHSKTFCTLLIFIRSMRAINFAFTALSLTPRTGLTHNRVLKIVVELICMCEIREKGNSSYTRILNLRSSLD